MAFPVDIWLRGENHATTETIAPVESEPRSWSDGEVASVLAGSTCHGQVHISIVAEAYK